MLPQFLRKIWNSTTKTGENGSTMAIVLIMAVIANVVIGIALVSSRNAIKVSKYRKDNVALLNVAEAGLEDFKAKVLHEGYELPPDSIKIFNNEADGTLDSLGFSYTVRCTVSETGDTLFVESTGMKGVDKKRIHVVMDKRGAIVLKEKDPRFVGAIMAKSGVIVRGNTVIDGRNIDTLTDAVIDPVTGKHCFGIITANSVDIDGNAAQIGGGAHPPVNDEVLSNPDSAISVRMPILKEGILASSVLNSINTPADFLDITESRLEEYKITKDELISKLPFKGLYVVEEDITSIDLEDCRGILVVHNSTNTATVNIIGGEDYRGIIIGDIVRIQGNFKMYGTILSLSTDSTFNIRGTPQIFYSKQVYDNLQNYCDNTGISIEQLSWLEDPDL